MALVLGGFIFTDYAIPEDVSLGGEHMFAVHKLIGGERVVDAMGPDDSDISWAGRFQGSDAVPKATALDALRRSGAQVPLVVDSQFYLVGVHKFEWTYERWYQIPYKITCLVVQSGGGFSFGSTLDTVVSADLNLATGIIGSLVGGAF